jgi:hypothetical protein
MSNHHLYKQIESMIFGIETNKTKKQWNIFFDENKITIPSNTKSFKFLINKTQPSSILEFYQIVYNLISLIYDSCDIDTILERQLSNVSDVILIDGTINLLDELEQDNSYIIGNIPTLNELKKWLDIFEQNLKYELKFVD